jgi:hypothetical protein
MLRSPESLEAFPDLTAPRAFVPLRRPSKSAVLASYRCQEGQEGAWEGSGPQAASALEAPSSDPARLEVRREVVVAAWLELSS